LSWKDFNRAVLQKTLTLPPLISTKQGTAGQVSTLLNEVLGAARELELRFGLQR